MKQKICCFFSLPYLYTEKLVIFDCLMFKFVVVTESQFDPVFKTCDRATIKTTDRPTF